VRLGIVGIVASIGLAIAALPPALVWAWPEALPTMIAQGAGFIPGYGLLVGECAHVGCRARMVDAVGQRPGPDRDDLYRSGGAAGRLGIAAYGAHADVYPFFRGHAEERIVALHRMTYLIGRPVSP
jgi:hypothetical protein